MDPERRRFLKLTGMTLAATACRDATEREEPGVTLPPCGDHAPPGNEKSRVAMAATGSPQRNGLALLDAWGGAESLFGREDAVILKPNSQWYAQGMTNTDLLAALIEAILARPGGFRGEIFVADNHHFGTDEARAWTTDKPNGRYNLNQLVALFKERGAPVAKVHWHDAGPNPEPWQFDAGWGTKLEPGASGNGYRWQLDDCHVTPYGNKCAMTWPVFDSPLSGDSIDLKLGVCRDGKPTGRPLRLINVSSINHHSRYAGVTAAVKNLMGIVDMTCGFHGPEPAGYCNTHYIGITKAHAFWRWSDRRAAPLKRVLHRALPEEQALEFHHTGGALAHWMRTVRRPDLHIVSAEWVGWGSRTHPDLQSRPGVSLAAKDPVTLDAVAAREVLLPATFAAGSAGLPFLAYNDPDNAAGPFRKFLQAAQREIGGSVDRDRVELARILLGVRG